MDINNDEKDKLNFKISGDEIMRFEANGDIYVRGKLVENDKEVVNGVREWLKLSTRVDREA